MCESCPFHTPPNACTSRGRSPALQHAEPRGAVYDTRSAILPRGALSYWREHSTGHACPASHAPRTSRPSMSRAIIAGIWFFSSLLGPCWSFVEAAARCRKSSVKRQDNRVARPRERRFSVGQQNQYIRRSKGGLVPSGKLRRIAQEPTSAQQVAKRGFPTGTVGAPSDAPT